MLHEFDLAHSDEEVLIIEWHMEWPGWDPWFHANPEDNTGRRWFYEINYIPFFRTDGWLPSNETSLPFHWEYEYYDNGETPVSLDITGTYNPLTRRGEYRVDMQSSATLPPGEYYLHAVIVEDITHHDGPYYNTFHKASPDYQGSRIMRHPAFVESEFDLNGDASGAWDPHECKLICWLQDRGGDKVVWQAESAYLTELTWETDAPELPASFSLGAAYPNPFNPEITLPLQMDRDAELRLELLTPDGRLVALLHEGLLEAGRHEFRWKGLDEQGRRVSSGVYLLHATGPSGSESQRLVLAK